MLAMRVGLRKETTMKPVAVVAILLIAAGLFGLAYGQFTYTRETHDAQIGPVDIQVRERERVDIPTWVSIACVAVGGAMLLIPMLDRTNAVPRMR
jgi:type VI protein secretion system component VasF